MSTLYIRDGDHFQEATSNVVLDRAKALIAQRFRTGSPALTNAKLLHEFLQLKLSMLEYEIFAALFLDSYQRLIEYVELFSRQR